VTTVSMTSRHTATTRTAPITTAMTSVADM
jgi:hypothetical protein